MSNEQNLFNDSLFVLASKMDVSGTVQHNKNMMLNLLENVSNVINNVANDQTAKQIFRTEMNKFLIKDF